MDPSSSDPVLSIFLQSPFLSTDFLIPALGMLVLLICSALVSGSEVAFFSLSPTHRESLKSEGDERGDKVLQLLEQPDKEYGPQLLLATILIVNNFVNIGIVLISTYLMPFILASQTTSVFLLGMEISATAVNLLIQVGLVTFLIVLFGEIIPKVYATNYSITLAKLMASPLLFSEKVFSWLSKPMIASTSRLQRKLGNRTSNFSVDELGHALELTHDEQRTHEEQKILEGIVNFGNIDVKQIMTSRMDVLAIPFETSYTDLVQIIIDAGFSRIPVYKKSLDEIAGILYVKDLLPHLNAENFNWQGVLRSPYFIPENKKIDDQLKEFQEKKIHMAIVVDEYGGTSGLVTLEDVIEEIVGEITDEFDNEDLKYSKLDEHNYIFEGKTQLIDIYRILDIDGSPLEAAKGESDTLAGFIIEQAGKIPLKGEKITFREFTFIVEASDKRKVKRVKLTINEEEQAEENKD